MTKLEVKRLIANILSEILNLSHSKIERCTNFISMGMDSKTVVIFCEKLSKEFKQNIGIEVIYDYPSLAELSEYFASNITEEKYEGSSSFNIDDIINKTLNEVLGRNEFFNDKDTFYSIGLDSVKLVTFVEKVNKIFNLSLGVETIFDFPTIGEFKENIINNSNEYDKDLSNEESFTEQGEKIAVIGMSGKLGENENLNEYWETILKGKSTIKKIHREGWNVNDTYSVASLIPNIAKFDCEFFNISPREALRMDPQQRVLMEEVYKALEDSGYSKKKLERKKVGVFIGARASDYINKNVFKEHGIESQMFLGSDMGIMAGRIAYFYDLKGPCLTVDTACSSSLTALHLACESIRRKESSMAIVGSVFLMTDSDFLVEAAKTGILSESGECRTFDENADGTILGEGTGAVILKPLKDAIKDNDNIHAVICGTAMNQDGKTNGITAPSAVSQEELIKSSLKNANTKAEDIGYIEVHGTGTKLGDPIEINALTKTFRKETDKKEFCYIGSHKPCVGHTIALSGLAGVFKTISILEKSKIPPVCKFNELNHHINLKDSPFVINRESVNWLHENNKKHKAAVSSFGFSGTNCSVILEEWKNENDVISKEKNYVFPISGRTEKALNRKISDLKEFLINNKDAQIGSIARVLQEGRDHFTFRKAFIANSVENLINQIEGNSSYNLFDIDEEIKSLKERYEKGEDINWSFDNKNKLISMPSYPFEGEDYWLSTNLENKEVKNEDETFKKRVFKDDVFIRDHFIQGKNVMPGAGQIVYTLEFLKKKFENDNLEIDNLNLFRPIVVNFDYTDFTFDLDEDLKKVEIKSHNGEVMTRAEVNLNTTYESYNNYINNENILSIDAKTIRKKDFYDNLTLKKNAIYGDTLQVVEEIKWDKDYAYGTLNYSESAFKETEKIISILDGALQCLLVFYMDNDNMAVPFSFEKVKLLKEFTSEVKVQIERTDKDEYNLSIMNFKGEICAILKGITLKVLDKKFNLDLFVPKWKRIEAPKLDDTNLINKNILIIYSKDGVEVKNKLEELHKMNYVNSLIIDENVIQNINSFRNVDEIYYISKISKKEVDINSLRELEEAEILSLEPLYKIVKGMDDSFKERQLKFTVITNNSYGTDVSLCTNPYSALMFGFVKSMSKEYYNWNISLFDLNYNALLENDFEDVKYTACDGFNNGEYLISDGKIYSQELAVLEKPDIKINPYKNNGVYVVVGGTGGIGLEYCKHLALTAHAKIVVIGRREYDNEIKEKLRIIEDLGGEFVYYSLNIADENSLSSMISEVKRRWGAINGVIHSALVLRDMEIKKMDERDLYDVLDPKVKGTWNLYNSFKNENLDFMLVFSSCQSFVGNPSQSNYAAASSFQDSFVSFIALNSSFPVKLINWGYWGSVGVVSNEKYNKIMKMQGYTSIEINDGMKVIDTILSSFVDRVVAIKAEDEVYKAMGVNKKITINTNLKTALPISDENLLLNIISRDKDEEIIEFLKDLDILQNTAKSKLMDILDSGDIKKSKRFERLLTELLGMMSRSKERNLISFKDFNISNPKLEGFNKLISACLENYKEIINGQVLATDIMFPGGKSSLVEPIYKDNPLSDYCIEVISRMIDNIISTWKRDGNKEKIKIIEIGSGTGSTAEKVCKCLSKFLKVEYCYTDISRSFLNYGSRKFNDKYDFIEYKILDIEKDPLSQGFNQGDFDIVIATNVLHATTNISKVLRNVKSLMKANGLVLINEITKKQDYLTMTFGLLDGWWKYEDKTYREAGSPILSEENWRKLLYKEGFKDTKFIGLPVDSKDIWSQHVIVSKNNECIEVYKLERTSQISNNMNIESKEVKLEVKQDNINEIILEKVCSIVEKCLGLRHEQMDIHKPFVDMGSDSIISMEIITDINKELNLKLKAIVLYDYNNVYALTEYIAKKYKDHIESTFNIEEVEEIKEEVNKHSLNVEKSEIDINKNDIAIIGISGRFADYENVEEFWTGLCKGKDSVREIPKERWDVNKFYDKDINNYDKTNSKWCGWLENFDEFDPSFFNISGSEAKYMDPQQRIFLEECWMSLEDAGYTGEKLSKCRCGVFAGIMEGDYLKRLQSLNIKLEPQAFWGNDSSILASRISYLLNLHGPCLTLNTACSSSFVAIDLACKSILTGESDIAIAGGAYVSSTPNYYILSSNAGMFSPVGKCKTFDNDADGFVLGEGAGTIVLKSLEKAVNDGDYIYGVIKGSAMNQDGKTNGITAPNGIAQKELELEVYRNNNINPETITYVEAHGTGTKLGDPIEFQALTNSFREFTDKKEFCGIGSLKSNIGHLSAASGVASLIKVLMAFKHNLIPPTINFNKINDEIDLEDSPFYINTELREWKRMDDKNRRAAISSFGFSGTNVHLVVEEWPRENYAKGFIDSNKDFLFVFSAKSEERLRKYIVNFIDFIRLKERNREEATYYNAANIAYSLQTGRKEMKYRMAVKADSIEDLIYKLNNYINEEILEDIFVGQADSYISSNNVLSGMMLKNASLEEMAKAWIKGIGVKWEELYEKLKVINVPLPKSVLLKKKYWIQGDIESRETKKEVFKDESINVDIYKAEWEEAILDLNLKDNSVVVIIDNDDRAFEYLKNNRKFRSIKFVLLVKDSLEIDESIRLLKERYESIDRIVNIADLSRRDDNVKEYSLFYLKLVQALKRNFNNKKINIIHAIKDSKDYTLVAQKALSGFAKTLKIENPNLSLKTVVLEENDIDLVINEIEDTKEVEVRYLNHKRMVKKLKAVEKDKKEITGELKEKGVYIITGGIGRLGNIIATNLAKEYKANLVICGRKDINSEIERSIDELKAYGARVYYYKTDISKYEEADKLIRDTLKAFGKINGVIHCAGTISKNLIWNKTSEDFETTLKSKVLGTINLDKALEDIDIDFFALFSSISSEIGTVYVSDYAYANSFMNYFAEFREIKKRRAVAKGKTIAMCWPLWRNGGMQIASEGQKYMKEKYGLEPLSSNEGWNVFKYLVRHEDSEAVIINDYNNKFALRLQEEKSKKTIGSTKTYLKGDYVQKTLIDICSKLFDLPESEIDIDSNFDEFGMDSIFMMKLLAEIETRFNTVVAPDTVSTYPTISKLEKYLMSLDIQVTDEPEEIEEIVEVQDVDFVEEKEETNFNNSLDSNKQGKKVAVIGLSLKFPGADSAKEYWEELCAGKEAFKVVDSRWENIKYSSVENKRIESSSKLKWGAFLDNIDEFDPKHFKIKEEDAIFMDPEQRLVLKLAQELFDNAGYSNEEINGKNINVLIGASDSSYIKVHKDQVPLERYNHILVDMITNMIASRLSDYFNLKGESAVINTACSSALVAIHKACQDILLGKCEMAIAGGVKLLVDPFEVAGFSEAGILSKDGKVRVFDKDASGTLLGEGAGLVLLKDYDKAVKDGDNILSVIVGTAANNDGKTMGLTVPDRIGQKNVIMSAIKQNNIDVNKIRYFEAHGTGTLLGDPIEIKAASEAYECFTNKKGYCGVGSVKSNIGHLLQAGGIAGFIKIVLSAYNKEIVPTLNCKTPHPRFRFEETPFYIAQNREKIEAENDTFYEAISSFGFGGTNCHAIIENFDEKKCEGYKRVRFPLGNIKWNNKKYWLGKIQDTQNQKADYSHLLKKIMSKELDPKEATKIILKFKEGV